MREIKFRAWNQHKKIFGYVTLHPQSVSVPTIEIFPRSCYGADYISFDNISLWQENTGLVDKNGKEIYEGDIIIRWGANGYESGCKEVKFRSSYTFQGWGIGKTSEYEIIGNIYENPELLNK